MFHFITISNGVAVIQHATEGHVYRFRPVQRDKWDKLILSGSESSEVADTQAETFAAAALRFAERISPECMGGSSDVLDTGPVQGRGAFSGWFNSKNTRLSSSALHETRR